MSNPKPPALAILILAVLVGCQQKPELPMASTGKPSLRLVAHIEMPKARDIAISGNRVFVAQNFEGMTELSATEPASPRVVRKYPPADIQPLDICASRPGYLSVADRFRGYSLWKLGRPDGPATSVSALALPGIATHVEHFSGERANFAAVACGGEGLAIVDVRDPLTPVLAGRMTLAVDYSRRVATLDEFVFLADHLDGGLKLCRIDSRGAPSLVAMVTMSGFCEAARFGGNLLYSSFRNYGYRIFEFDVDAARADHYSTAALRHLSTAYRSDDRVREILPIGVLLLVANDALGVDMYDASDPSRPVVLDSLALQGECQSLEEHSGYIYAACWDGGLSVLQIVQPDEP